MYVYSGPATPQCGTHSCTDCNPGDINCGMRETGPTAFCERHHNLSHSRMWINHYAFQSAEHWETKKMRGRTNLLPSRVGGVPASYERLLDRQAMRLLDRRIAAVAHRPLRHCLETLFAK